MRGPLDHALRLFRDETAVEVDEPLTRQRIEAGWLLHRARARRARRFSLVAVAALGLGSGALAASSLVLRARPARPAGATSPVTPRPAAPRPPRAIAPAAPSGEASHLIPLVETAAPPVAAWSRAGTASATNPTDAATAAYAAAHRAHFVDRDWSRALGQWTRYLRLAPDGPLVPEAHFNRAICLLHLERSDDAVTELRPFAAGRWGRYRQADARRLLAGLVPGPRSPGR